MKPTGVATLSARAQPPPTETETESDPDLWRRAAAGDQSSFTLLFERHATAVWNHAYRLTGSWATAEDVASTVFLTAWRKRAEMTLVRDSALPWLYAVAGNVVRSERRSAARFLRALRRVPDESTVDDHADAVAGRVDDDRRMREVLAAVETLPRAEREVVDLCLLGELSTSDAAAAMRVAEVSVRSRMSRARARLRTLLEETP
ncbi:RNA polymerase ECF family sigma subunit [Herbihabitans rhizosphaerae]|uniref:RNA polymerase ECF family sigma subunit n=1 Tax=Herbihabitans rhizosphaerae TaxID=1872711 RepID=A0A4V2EU37_9PSEU|nr:RNA polymerase sigma factor [Herbihabitans rhizosphaerae]RZS43213.1 RNA polymerase ECF family sigma subunit [Herbihabitans rhizosphaerae]